MTDAEQTVTKKTEKTICKYEHTSAAETLSNPTCKTVTLKVPLRKNGLIDPIGY